MYVPGRNPTIELLRSAHSTNTVLLQEGIKVDAKIAEILEQAQAKRIPIKYVSRAHLSKVLGNDEHQGVIAETKMFVQPSSEIGWQQGGGYIYIREAQYEQNIGAIIRTAEALGFTGVIIPPEQRITPTVIRISMGAIFHIPVYSASLFPAIKEFKQNGFSVYGIERGNDKPLGKVIIQPDALLIIGGEDHELSEEILNRCDDILTIPQAGQVNSLNMSVAAGIAMYEYIRQSR
jgi:23S rRNA (guanosine2251-2'-O)-methyltransferase